MIPFGSLLSNERMESLQGVLGCRQAPFNTALETHFGRISLDWTSFSVPRLGGALLECFNADQVRVMSPNERQRHADGIAAKIVQALMHADDALRTRREALEDGCSSTGCVLSGEYSSP